MALPLPHRPGVSSPHLPMPPPAATTAPAFTSPATAAASFPSQAPGSSPTLSPHARPFKPAGRSKESQWSDSSSASDDGASAGAGTSGYRSFREVVVASLASKAPTPPSPVPAQAPRPRILLRSEVARPQQPKRVPDADGWMRKESRATRRKLYRPQPRPRRLVPADLRGLCFNCFSPAHRAAQCRSRPRCFKCRGVGHRSYVCPGAARLAGERLAPGGRVLVWRRISATAPTMESAAGMASAGAAQSSVEAAPAVSAPEEGRARRQRRPRRRRRPARDGSTSSRRNFGANSGDASPGQQALDDGASPALTLPYIINWSDRLAQAEQALHRAVIATIVGDVSQASSTAVAGLLAAKFDLDAAALPVHRASPSAFIVVLADEAEACRVASDNSEPPGNGSFRVHCRRWTRQALSGTILPSRVDVELQGVPAHAWEVSTAESLLNPFAWVEQIHENTRNREDYSVFRLKAWCLNLEVIPPARDLVIVEPPTMIVESPPVKRALSYPVQISVSISGSQRSEHSSPGDGGSDNPSERRHPRPSVSEPRMDSSRSADIGHSAPARPPVRDGAELSGSGVRQLAGTARAAGSPLVPEPQAVEINAAECNVAGKETVHTTANVNEVVIEELCRAHASLSIDEGDVVAPAPEPEGFSTCLHELVLFHEDTQSAIAEPYGPAVTEAPIPEILVPVSSPPTPPAELATEENFSGCV